MDIVANNIHLQFSLSLEIGSFPGILVLTYYLEVPATANSAERLIVCYCCDRELSITYHYHMFILMGASFMVTVILTKIITTQHANQYHQLLLIEFEK